MVLLRGDAEVASWPLTCSGPPDLAVVDELARLQLAARRHGCQVRLRHASEELLALVAFLGLRDVLPG